MQIDWPPAHSEALRQYRARGMSYAEAAETINATFGTDYSRSAAIGGEVMNHLDLELWIRNSG